MRRLSCELPHDPLNRAFSLAFIRNDDGRGELLQLVGGELYHRYMPVIRVGWPASGLWRYTGWERIGRAGVLLEGPISVAMRSKDHHLEVFARDPRTGTIVRTVRQNPGTWADWAPVENPPDAQISGAPYAVTGPDGRIRLFARAGRQLFFATQSEPDGHTYRDWRRLDGGEAGGDPTAVVSGDTIHVFVRDPDGHPAHTTLAGAQQGPWETLDPTETFDSRIAVALNAAGVPDLAMATPGRSIRYAHGVRAADGRLAWQWSAQAGDVIGDPAIVVRDGRTLVFSAFDHRGAARWAQTQDRRLSGGWQSTPEAAFATTEEGRTLVTSPVAETVTGRTGSAPEVFMMIDKGPDPQDRALHETAMFVRRPGAEWTTNTEDWPQPS
nr:hypothetical protein GCM10020092_072460 [Actinoplanes digitatis]